MSRNEKSQQQTRRALQIVEPGWHPAVPQSFHMRSCLGWPPGDCRVPFTTLSRKKI
jgi:hypothetical protein